MKTSVTVIKFLFFIFLFSKNTFLIAQTAPWSIQMGGGEADLGSNSVSDIIGNLYTTGTFSGTSVFGTYNITSAGKGDIFITKTNSGATIEWVRQLGSADDDYGNSITYDPLGDIYCTGRFSGTVVFGAFTLTASGASEAYVVKLNSTNGNIIWAKKLGGSGSDGGMSITSDVAGNIFISGYFQGTGIFDTYTLSPVGQNFNIFIAKIDGSNGNVSWAKGFGSSGFNYGSAIACDGNGDAYLTGNFESAVIFGPYTLTASQYQDIFISKHDGVTGSVIWANSMGGSGNDNGTAITINSDGNIYSTGRFENECTFGTTTLTTLGGVDMYVCKTDATSGNLIWVKQIGGQGYDQANGITRDAAGNIFLTGQFNGIINTGSFSIISNNADAFLFRINSFSGDVTWAEKIGGASNDIGYGITYSSYGNLYLTGVFQGTAIFGGNEFTSKGGTDIFVLKLIGATVGVETSSLSNDQIKLYPNPFKDQITISLGIKEYCALSITDALGKIVFQLKDYNAGEILDLEMLKQGVYCLTITSDNSSLVKRIVRE
jgi:hypothetical protein